VAETAERNDEVILPLTFSFLFFLNAARLSRFGINVAASAVPRRQRI
jgi:hypothetical protein